MSRSLALTLHSFPRFFFSLGHKSAAAGNYANMPRFLYATRRLGCYQHGCPGSVVVITPDWYARVVEGRGFKSRSGYYKFFFLYFFLHFNVYFNMLRIYIYKKKTLRVMGNTYSPGDSIILCLVCLCPNMPEHVVILLSDWCFATSSEKEHRPASSVALTEFVTPRDTVTHTHTLVSRHFTKSTLQVSSGIRTIDNEQMLLCDWLRPI